MRTALLPGVVVSWLLALSAMTLADAGKAAPVRTYFTIPIFGQLGREVTAVAVDKALDAAVAAKADYVVLLLDSDGGNLIEAERIVATLARHNGLPTVALVKKAMGPSVALSFACRHIFLYEQGSASLLMPQQLNGRAVTEEQLEQLRGALRRNLMAACELSGRDSLLALGMIDPDLNLYATPGVPVRIELRRSGPQAEWIKRPGQVLTFDRSNAVQCGYAEGLCGTMEQLALKMGLSDGWTSAGDGGRQIMQAAADQFRSEQEKTQFQREHAVEIDRLLEKVKAERLSLQQIEQGQADLEQQRKQLVRQAEQTYQRDGDDKARDASLEAIRQEYQTKSKHLTAAMEKLQASLEADLLALKQMQEKMK